MSLAFWGTLANRSLLGLLVAAHLVLAAVWFWSPDGLSAFGRMIIDAALPVQVSLACLLLVFRSGTRLLRYAVRVVTFVVLALLAAAQAFGAEGIYQPAMVQAAVLLPPLGLLYWRGYRLDQEHRLTPSRFKFSIGGLFGVTAAVAVAFGLAQFVRTTYGWMEIVPRWYVFSTVGSAMALNFLIGTLALLAGNDWRMRTLGYAMLVPLLGAAPGYIWSRPRDMPWMIGWFATSALLYGGSLLAIRGLGYRLGRRMRSPSTSGAKPFALAVPVADKRAVPGEVEVG